MAIGDKGIGWPIHVYKLTQNYFGRNHRANTKSRMHRKVEVKERSTPHNSDKQSEI